MARPIKTGLDYSPQQTDIHNNRKIKRLITEFGAKGYLIYDYIKAQCFKENGYWIQHDDNFCFDVSDALKAGITEELVSEVILGCIRLCLFNEGVWNMSRIITSAGIQKRYYEAKRNPIINSKIWVIDAKTIVNAAIINENNTISAQSKVKESKENKSKENGYADTQPPEASNVNVYANIEKFKIDAIIDVFFISTITAKGVDPGKIPAWLEAFNRRLIFTKDTLKSERDYRSHFGNWLVKIPNYRFINPEGYDAVKDVPQLMELRKVVVEHNGGEVIWTEEQWKRYCNNPAACGYTFIRYEL